MPDIVNDSAMAMAAEEFATMQALFNAPAEGPINQFEIL